LCSKIVETSFLKSIALGLVTIIFVSSTKKISLDLIFIFGKSCSIFPPQEKVLWLQSLLHIIILCYLFLRQWLCLLFHIILV